MGLVLPCWYEDEDQMGLTSSKVANARYGKVLQVHQKRVSNVGMSKSNFVEILDTALQPVLRDS